MARNRSMRKMRNRSRSKRGGVDNNQRLKDNILVYEIKNHIKQADDNLLNFDTIMKRALENPTLDNSATKDNNDEYKRKVIEYLKENWTNNGEVLGSSPRHPAAAAADPYDSDSDYSDNEGFGGGKSRRLRRHRTIKKYGKVRKSRKSRRKNRSKSRR